MQELAACTDAFLYRLLPCKRMAGYTRLAIFHATCRAGVWEIAEARLAYGGVAAKALMVRKAQMSC